MGRSGIPITNNQRLEVIKLYSEGKGVDIITNTVYLDEVSIRNIISDHENDLIDARGYKKGAVISMKNNKIDVRHTAMHYIK